jgi:hypothetical protein
VRRVPFSCFALPDSFSAVFRASHPVFLFCAPGLVFDSTEGVGYRFLILRTHTHFRRYRGRQVPFSCFALPNSYFAVSWASGHVFMFCAPGLIFGGTEDFGSRFNLLRSRTNIRRYRGRRVPFSCFVLPYSFSTVPNASGPVFIFCPPRLIFGGIEGVRSHFHVLRARTRFWRYRGRQVLFSCFVLPNAFSAVPRASGPVFIFCSPGLIFGGTEGVGSCFHVLRADTHFRRCRMCRVSFSWIARPDSFRRYRRRRVPFSCFALQDSFRWYRGRRVPFSCFALPDSFSAVLRALGPIFMFCAPGLVFFYTEGVGSRFHVLCSRTRFLFGGAEGVGSRFHILPVRTHFRRYRGLLDPLTCFAS